MSVVCGIRLSFLDYQLLIRVSIASSTSKLKADENHRQRFWNRGLQHGFFFLVDTGGGHVCEVDFVFCALTSRDLVNLSIVLWSPVEVRGVRTKTRFVGKQKNRFFGDLKGSCSGYRWVSYRLIGNVVGYTVSL